MNSGVGEPDDLGGLRSDADQSRRAERFTLLVRAAKIIADGREYLCVMRDISATGVKLRMFHKLPQASRLELDIGNGEHHAMRLMWVHEDHAGFQFEHEIDVNTPIDDRNSPHPKRPIRLSIDKPLILHSGAVAHAAVLHNISQGGACVSCDHRLMVRQLVRMEVEGLEAIFAKVCWRLHPRHGMVFERQLTLQELAATMLILHGEYSTDGEGAAARVGNW